ncbi:uncharacterized protein BDV14DRAFT_128895 [Aspergillus stella-maris]|uniref:uncharacterized protein n=1 Tax=Aspergillus stella-maris TaxID=1810926 RepID=UPI003CCCFC2F
MPFFRSSKMTPSRDPPFSWYWAGKPIRSGYSQGESISEVHTDNINSEPWGYHPDQCYTCTEQHRHQHSCDSEPARRFCCLRRVRYPRVERCYSPMNTKPCQRKSHYNNGCSRRRCDLSNECNFHS